MIFVRNITKLCHNQLYTKKCILYSKNCLNTELYFGSKIEVPSPPKRPPSGYMMFCKESRKKVLEQNPDLRNTDVMKMLAQKWCLLPKDVKEPYEMSARESMGEYGKALTKFVETLTEEQKMQFIQQKAEKRKSRNIFRQRKVLRNSGLPKSSCSAYALFVQSEARNSSSIKHVSEFIKKVAENWKSLSEDSKKVYEIQAQADKIRYKKELAEWQEKVLREKKVDVIKAFVLIKGRWKSVDAEFAPVGKKSIAAGKELSKSKADG